MHSHARSGLPAMTLALSLVPLFISGQALADYKGGEFSCPADRSWITNPSAPAHVPNEPNTNFCDFYQFSWQWFLDLVSPSATESGKRNFEVTADYPILESGDADSCDDTVTGTLLRSAINKATTIPERTGQAGTGGQGIYDQNGNVVFYDVRFSRNLCDIGKIQAQPNFPGGTVELKTAWKQMASGDNQDDYFIMQADIDGVPGEETLGMIGFHVAVATDEHPEMVWASYEHRNNNPPCDDLKAPAPEGKWSFMDPSCATNSEIDCHFNKTVTVTGTSGQTPTNICTVHPGGTAPGDPHYDENAAALNQLNEQVHGMLSDLPADDPMAVWRNYINIGALWVSDIKQPSANANDVPLISNQRGSLRLANTVMETDYQDGFSATGQYHEYNSNCFGCHEYTVDPDYRNTGPHNGGDVSHIFQNDIVTAQCKTTREVEAGPIWSDKDAQAKCATTCSTKGGWDGNWHTTVPGQMSVCNCCGN